MKKILETLKQKWAEYLLEVFVIIIGILGAFALNTWNESRKGKIIEVEILEGLEREMTANQDQLIEVISNHKKSIDAAKELIQIFDKDIPQESGTVLDSLFNDFLMTWTYDPRMGKVNSIIMSGKINYLNNKGLKSNLTSFVEEVTDANELNLRFLELKYWRLDPLLDLLISRKNRYHILLNDQSISKSSFESDYKTVFRSLEIENVINQMWALAKLGLIEEEEHLASLNETLSLIDQALED